MINTLATPYPTLYVTGEIPGLRLEDMLSSSGAEKGEGIDAKVSAAISAGYAEQRELASNSYWLNPEGFLHTRPPIKTFDEYRLFGRKFVVL